MSALHEMSDDQERWQHVKGSEPEWVKDMCCVPWVVTIEKNGDIQIMDADGKPVCKMAHGNKEIAATIASVICDQVNAI